MDILSESDIEKTHIVGIAIGVLLIIVALIAFMWLSGGPEADKIITDVNEEMTTVDSYKVDIEAEERGDWESDTEIELFVDLAQSQTEAIGHYETLSDRNDIEYYADSDYAYFYDDQEDWFLTSYSYLGFEDYIKMNPEAYTVEEDNDNNTYILKSIVAEDDEIENKLVADWPELPAYNSEFEEYSVTVHANSTTYRIESIHINLKETDTEDGKLTMSYEFTDYNDIESINEPEGINKAHDSHSPEIDGEIEVDYANDEIYVEIIEVTEDVETLEVISFNQGTTEFNADENKTITLQSGEEYTAGNDSINFNLRSGEHTTTITDLNIGMES